MDCDDYILTLELLILGDKSESISYDHSKIKRHQPDITKHNKTQHKLTSHKQTWHKQTRQNQNMTPKVTQPNTT